MPRFMPSLSLIALILLAPAVNAQGLDYYNVYPLTAGTPPPPGVPPVDVTSTLGRLTTTLGVPQIFMVPAIKHEVVPDLDIGVVPGLSDPISHLTCYSVDNPLAGPSEVIATHQFGAHALSVGLTAQLCVPTKKLTTPEEINLAPFLCFDASGALLQSYVSLEDQFQLQEASLLEPLALCAPAEIDGAGILNPVEHLACYNYTPGGELVAGQIPITNAFFPDPFIDFLTLGAPSTLCMPATVEFEPPGTLDHFSVYPVLPDPLLIGPHVELTDQFGSEPHDLGMLNRFLVPADNNGGGIIDPFSHLSCYELANSEFEPPDVIATHQFGVQRLDLGPPVAACAPTEKLIHPGEVTIDYFKCYPATGAALGLDITWTDQFQQAPVTLAEPFMFCNPAAATVEGVIQNGGVIQNPDGHLACFMTTPADFPPAPTTIPIQNPLHPALLEIPIMQPDAFCLPSQKEIVQPGEIIIVKDTKPDSGVDFAFSTSGGLIPAEFALDDDADDTLLNVQNFVVSDGSYTVTEATHPDYDTTVGCIDPDGGSSTQDATATIDLDPGETVTCVFTNIARPGTIIIVKDTVPDNAQDFAFSTSGGLSPATFNLDNDTDPTLPHSHTFSGVLPGPYSVTEEVTSGYDTTVECDDPDGGSSTQNRTATIDLDPNETVTCTFTNTVDTSFGLDHFSVYPATGPVGPSGVKLTDQFGEETHNLGELIQFLSPADKNGEGVIDPFNHLSCYGLTDGVLDPPDVLATNQFGQQRLDLGPPIAACVPTKVISPAPSLEQEPHNIDYFKCYAASGDALTESITWTDLFQTADVTFDEPYMFCNPTSLNGGGIKNPDGHLACFITPPTGDVLAPSSVLAFEIITGSLINPLEMVDPAAFCVPSAKQIVPPGEIVIIKDTVPDDEQDFSFSTTGGLSPATFDLDDDGDDATLPNVQAYVVADGTYTVTEAANAGYVTSVKCVDPDGGSSTLGATATIDLDPGETVTCNFRNAVNRIFEDGFELFCPEAGIDVRVEQTNPAEEAVAGKKINLTVTVENTGSAELSITTLEVTANGEITDIIGLLPVTELAPGEVVEIQAGISTSESDDNVLATVAVEADGPCESSAVDTDEVAVPLCTLGDIDIEVDLKQNDAGIERLAGAVLEVTVVNIGATEFTITELIITIDAVPEDLMDQLPGLDLLPGQVAVVEYLYLDDGDGFVSGEAAVAAVGPCGPSINAVDVFDMPIIPDD